MRQVIIPSLFQSYNVAFLEKHGLKPDFGDKIVDQFHEAIKYADHRITVVQGVSNAEAFMKIELDKSLVDMIKQAIDQESTLDGRIKATDTKLWIMIHALIRDALIKAGWHAVSVSLFWPPQYNPVKAHVTIRAGIRGPQADHHQPDWRHA